MLCVIARNDDQAIVITKHKIIGPDWHPAADNAVVDGATLERNRTSGSVPEGKDRKIRPSCQCRDVANRAICNETGDAFSAGSSAQVLADNGRLEIGTGVNDDNGSRFGMFDGMDSGTNISGLAPGGHRRAEQSGTAEGTQRPDLSIHQQATA